MAKNIGLNNNNGEDYDVKYLLRLYREAKTYLEQFPPGLTCKSVLFLNDYLWQEVKSPNFWEHVKDSDIENTSFKDFLFGHDLAKINIMKIIESRGLEHPICIPLYVLCYLFDENELTNDELKNTSEETAQYSLHVVGLVVCRSSCACGLYIMVADPNGALQGGSNMEFLSMPLTKLESKSTTRVSRYDRDKRSLAEEKVKVRAQAQAQAQEQVKKMKKEQVEEKAKAFRITKGEAEEDQNAKGKRAVVCIEEQGQIDTESRDSSGKKAKML
jgi:hypothetical protein